MLRRGQGALDPARRRRRDPLRGPGRRPGHARDAARDRGDRRRGARRLGRARSPTAASPARRTGSWSATSRPRRSAAGRSPRSRRATRSCSTSRRASYESSSPTTSSRRGCRLVAAAAALQDRRPRQVREARLVRLGGRDHPALVEHEPVAVDDLEPARRGPRARPRRAGDALADRRRRPARRARPRRPAPKRALAASRRRRRAGSRPRRDRPPRALVDVQPPRGRLPVPQPELERRLAGAAPARSACRARSPATIGTSTCSRLAGRDHGRDAGGRRELARRAILLPMPPRPSAGRRAEHGRRPRARPRRAAPRPACPGARV